MTRRDEYRTALGPLDPAERIAYLREHSGLPGPRGNLELMAAAVDLGDPAFFATLIATGEEYLVSCGAVGLGTTADDPVIEARLRSLATDSRWRVREGVAMGLQRFGDAEPARLRDIVDAWADDPHPLVQRAAVAAICEPRLLRGTAEAAHAVEVCRRVTDSLAARPAARRRDDAVRSLRKTLGYGWSVAVAADPEAGLPSFRRLAESAGGDDPQDPDVRWIVRENLKKARLVKLLDAAS